MNLKKLNNLTCKYLPYNLSLPKNYYFPPGVTYCTKLVRFSTDFQEETISEVTEPTVKQHPPSKSGKHKNPPIPRF